ILKGHFESVLISWYASSRMNTSLSTGCVESSSSFERLGASPSSEVFHGTSASDFGESSLPSTDMPDICTSPLGFSAEVVAGFFAPPTAAVRGAAASSATAEPLATSNETETMSARCICLPSEHGCADRRSTLRPACRPASLAGTPRSYRGRTSYPRDTGRRESQG